ncbi:uncharacterized protein LOC134183353 isoform X2 [Corticium candelabrum]|uniref:uncharacterized protein LOC134183353 isoform X2 n=1 Tax=Corticium candelabrum TaxID=121492 RepID=UPI002E261108|nr:uncharacterized protein LOC134183353 isoform X2 [Corticium candelabrum]
MSRCKNNQNWFTALVVVIVVVAVAIATVPFIVKSLHSSEKGPDSVHVALQDNSSLICDMQDPELLQSNVGFYAVKHDGLYLSACLAYLPWINDSSHSSQQKSNNFSEIIAVTVDNGCDFHKTEIDLKRLSTLIRSLNASCSSVALPFICGYFYRPFGNVSYCELYWPTRDQCLAVELVHCQSEWKFVESVLQSRDYCIQFPDCKQLLTRQKLSNRIATLSSATNESQYKTLFVLIVHFVGRRAAYCSSNDLFSSWLHPTQFCVVQGAVFHFSYLVCIMLLSMSIFNFTIAIYEVRRPEVEAIVSAVLLTASYQTDPLVSLMCLPKTTTAFTCSFTVPTLIAGVIAFTMILLIIKRMRKSSQFQAKQGAINKNTKIAGVIITRQFLVLIAVGPLVFTTIFTTFEVYPQFWSDEFTKNTTNYIICQQTNSSSDCISFVDETGFIVFHFIITVCLAVFTVLLMIYSLVPAPARKLWSNHFKSLKKCGSWKVMRKKNDENGERLMEEVCNMGVSRKTQTKQKCERNAVSKSIDDGKEIKILDSCHAYNEEISGRATDINHTHCLSHPAVVCDTAVDIHIQTRVDKGPSLKRAVSLIELRRRVDPVEGKVVKALTVCQELQRTSSLQELVRYSQLN